MALRLKSDCGDIEVLFHHREYDEQEIDDMAGETVDGPRRCSGVVVKVDGVVRGDGIAICHPNDNFNKSVGRKKALRFALKLLNKCDRTNIWNAYGKEVGLT